MTDNDLNPDPSGNGNLVPGAGGGPQPGSGAPSNLARSLARDHTAEAVKTLVEIMRDGKKESARVLAAKTLLDRGWGQAAQPLTNGDGGPLLPPAIQIVLMGDEPPTSDSPTN